DTAARAQARDLVARLGRAGWFASIGELDLRAACLVRETLAGASPLADAMFALQALGTVPILLAGHAPLTERWLPAVLAGPTVSAPRARGTSSGWPPSTACARPSPPLRAGWRRGRCRRPWRTPHDADSSATPWGSSS